MCWEVKQTWQGYRLKEPKYLSHTYAIENVANAQLNQLGSNLRMTTQNCILILCDSFDPIVAIS